MEYLGITAAREQLSTLVKKGSRTIIVRKNTPQAVLLPIEDFRRLIGRSGAGKMKAEFIFHLLGVEDHVLEQHDQVMSGEEEETVDFSRGSAEELLKLAKNFAE